MNHYIIILLLAPDSKVENFILEQADRFKDN